jgi:hypothetical protein
MSAHDERDPTPPEFRLNPPPGMNMPPELLDLDPIELELPELPELPTPSVLGGQTIDHAQFKARGWFRPIVTAQAGDECVTIRFDDSTKPELWAELTLSAETVAELLARILGMRPVVEQAALDCLRSISEHLPR